MTDPPPKKIMRSRGRPFQKGWPGGPGRPRGSRSIFAEKVFIDLLADWKAHGAQALVKCRLKHVDVYLQFVAKLMPAEFKIEAGDSFRDLLEMMGERIREQRRLESGTPGQLELAASVCDENSSGDARTVADQGA